MCFTCLSQAALLSEVHLANALTQLNIFWHKRDTFWVQRTQVRLFIKSNQIRLGRLLQRLYPQTLPAEFDADCSGYFLGMVFISRMICNGTYGPQKFSTFVTIIRSNHRSHQLTLTIRIKGAFLINRSVLFCSRIISALTLLFLGGVFLRAIICLLCVVVELTCSWVCDF